MLSLVGGSARGQDSSQEPAKPPADAKPKAKVNVAHLLSNPIPAREEFKFLYLRRRWLAGQTGQPEAFERIAGEFAGRGAYFSAVELLWFADKLTRDAARQADYQEKMRAWLKLAEPSNKRVEEGTQLFTAGKRREAIDHFYAVIRENPYCEKGHYQVANTHFLIFVQEQARADEEMPLAVREKIFRLTFEQLQFTIAIDPLLYEAYYLLSTIREIIPDDQDFLLQSQGLTERALAFRNDVLPPMEKIEAGAREAVLFEALGRGFESVGVLDYAVFAYQAAIFAGSRDPEIRGRLDALVKQYFTN